MGSIHVSRGVTAIEDVGVKRLTKMTSGESFDSKAVQENGRQVEIANPNPIIFPTRIYSIPKNQLGVTTPLEFTMRIINNTSAPFCLNRYQPFIPELLSSDGQIKDRVLFSDEPAEKNTQINKPQDSNKTRKFEWWKIPSGLPVITSLIAKILWQNNLLQLQISTIFGSLASSISWNSYWCFDALQPETYRLRFILNIDREATPFLESDTKAVTIAQETESDLLATPWVNLRLALPLSTDSSAIEVDGVQFKTDLGEPVLAIPPRLPGAETPIKLSISVTNNTSVSFRFEQLDSVHLNLIDDDDKEIRFTSDLMRLWVGKGPNYYLAQPGETTFFVLDGKLFWHCSRLVLAIPNKAGGFYYFPDLKPGKYQMRVIYHVSERRANYLNEKVLERVWNGWIAMPFVEFRLVE